MAKQDITVKLFYSGSWHVLPVYTRSEIRISLGDGDEQSGPTPASVVLTIDDRESLHNPKNPTSPLYGLAGRNTPIQVILNGTDIRMTGEIAEWKPQRSEDFVAGADRGDSWVEIVANGVLRRIGQGTDPRSALRRTIAGSDPLAYWPMEDGQDADRAASGIPGGQQLVIESGVINFEQDGGPVGSAGYAAVVESPADVLSATLPTYTATGGWQVSLWCKGVGTQAGGVGFNFDDQTFMGIATSTGDQYLLGMANAYPGNWSFYVQLNAGAFVNNSASLPVFPGGLDGEWHLLQLLVTQATATTVNFSLYADGDFIGTSSGVAGTGLPRLITVPDHIGFVEAAELGAAHIAVHATDTLVDQWDAGTGHIGETAADRIERLCDERGVGFTLVGDAADTQAMGPQRTDTTLNLFAETARTDSGLLADSRDQLGLTFRTGRSLYHQTAALALSYTAGHLATLDPVLDDQNTRNDVTVNRREGSSARAVQETGPMNVQDPTDDPQGVGRTVTTVDINPATDDVLPQHAYWHLHFGIVDEIRYPRVTVDLDAAPSLAATVSAVEIGDLITIATLPADLSPDLARLIVLGITEQIGSHRRQVTFNCAPASPYDIGIWDETVTPTSTRWGTESSTTSGAITTGTSTSVSVATAAGGPLWTTNPAHYPRDVDLLGARVRVTAMSGAASPQTATISTDVVNGVRKSIPSGTPVRLWQPAQYGL